MEPIPTQTNDARGVAKFLCSHIFSRFGTLCGLIIDRGTHFYNKLVDSVVRKYSVWHCTTLSYHPQTNGQEKVANREIKSILEKTVNSLKKEWVKKIEMRSRPYRTISKTPQGCHHSDLCLGKRVLLTDFYI